MKGNDTMTTEKDYWEDELQRESPMGLITESQNQAELLTPSTGKIEPTATSHSPCHLQGTEVLEKKRDKKEGVSHICLAISPNITSQVHLHLPKDETNNEPERDSQLHY